MQARFLRIDQLGNSDDFWWSIHELNIVAEGGTMVTGLLACDSFDWLYKEGCEQPRMMSLGVHLRIIGRPGRIGYFEKFLDYIMRHDDVWITTRLDIARSWSEQHPYEPS